jgi:hypothetical protein
MSLLSRSALYNRKEHATDCDQPQSCAVEQIQLEGQFSEVPFLYFGPGSFIGTREAEDLKPINKSRLFFGLI